MIGIFPDRVLRVVFESSRREPDGSGETPSLFFFLPLVVSGEADEIRDSGFIAMGYGGCRPESRRLSSTPRTGRFMSAASSLV